MPETFIPGSQDSSPAPFGGLRARSDLPEGRGARIAVRVELLSGASKSDRLRLRRALSTLPVLYPSDETWRLIDAWIDAAGAAGQRFGLGALLIAALARESGSLIWSFDADVTRMSHLGFVDRYEP